MAMFNSYVKLPEGTHHAADLMAPSDPPNFPSRLRRLGGFNLTSFELDTRGLSSTSSAHPDLPDLILISL